MSCRLAQTAPITPAAAPAATSAATTAANKPVVRNAKSIECSKEYLFGAICSNAGEAAGLVLPRRTIAAMNAHLIEISQAVAPGAHAILILDKAGWQTTDKVTLPANITLLPPPPRCPELNPAENIWQYV